MKCEVVIISKRDNEAVNWVKCKSKKEAIEISKRVEGNIDTKEFYVGIKKAK